MWNEHINTMGIVHECWFIAEVKETALKQACFDMCQGIKDCYCGLCSAQHESAVKENRGPISKKRNKYLQSMLIEAVNLAPRWNPQLAMLHEKELTRGNGNRATLAVARKLVIYMLAVYTTWRTIYDGERVVSRLI
jgi:hypothetical protein